MPIESNIALGVKPVQLESPVNQMAQMYQLQGAQQSNQLNQMKMDEYTRGVAEQEQFKNALAGSQDEAGIKNAFYSLGEKGVKGYSDYLKSKGEQLKSAAETKNLGFTGEKTQGEILKAKTEHGAQMLRDLSRNPSDANVTAHFEDIQQSPLYTPQEKQAAQGRLQEVMSMSVPDRQAYLASQGASAADLKPTIRTQNLGNRSDVFSDPAFGGAPTQLSSTAIGQSPDSVASGIIQTRGQNLTNARDLQRIGLEERKVKVAETTGAPGYVKPLTATQQYKLDKLKTADKTNAKLFDSSIDAELKNIDKLIGTEAAPKLHPGLSSATGPIASRLPTGRTDTANAEAYIKSLQSKASINSLQTIRGTAGAIGTMTEREWPRLESMKATLQETQGTDQFVQALKDYRDELKNMKLRSKEALTTDYSTAIGAPAPSATPNVDALLEKYN